MYEFCPEAVGYPTWLEWIPFFIYYAATIPQIITNYRNQSTTGLSFRMVFFDYTGAISTTTYTYLLALPLACRVMEPLMALNIGVLAVQGYYYTQNRKIRRNIAVSYTLLHLFCFAMVLCGLWYRNYIGHMMGWISLVIQFFTQMPQVVKNRRRRSVRGLSFLYISMLGLAALLEMAVSYFFRLPIQSFLNGLRGVGYYAVLCVQFYKYRRTMRKWW